MVDAGGISFVAERWMGPYVEGLRIAVERWGDREALVASHDAHGSAC